MAEHAEAPAETSSCTRRQILTLMATAAGGGFAMTLAGCAEEQTQGWKRPEWFRSKQGSNGNGAGRR
jgi:hypothetical protein